MKFPLSLLRKHSLYLVLVSGVSAVALLSAIPSFADSYIIDGGDTETVTGTKLQNWDASGMLYVGETGQGTLVIRNGGVVTSLGGVSGGVFVGEEKGAHGSLIVDGAGSALYAGGVLVGSDGNGTLMIRNGGTVSGASALLLGVSESGQGAALVDAGSVWLNGAVSIGGYGTGSLTVRNGGSFVSDSGLYAGNGASPTQGANTLTISTGGTVTIGGSGVSLGSRGAHSNGVAVVDGAGSTLRVKQNRGGGFFVGEEGSGTLVIRNGGTVYTTTDEAAIGYSGSSTGVAIVDGAGSKWWNSGKVLSVGNQGKGTLTIRNGGVVEAPAQVKVGYGGTVNIGGPAGEAAAGAGTLTYGTSGGDAAKVTLNGTLNFNTTGGVTFNNDISSEAAGGGTINQYAGTTVLYGLNSGFSGQMNILGGTVSVDDDLELGAKGAVLNFNGGVLQVTGDFFDSIDRKISLGDNGGGFDIADADNTFTVAQALSGNGSLAKLGAGTLTLLGNNSYAGGTTISAGTLKLGDGVTDGAIVGDVVDNASLVVNNLNATTLSGAISGTGSLTQAGAGTLTLAGNNSYAGGTNLNGGVISVAQDHNLGAASGALNFNGGTLQVTGTDFEGTGRAISWGANGGSFDIVNAGNTFALSSQFTGSGGLTKDGAGTLALSGNSSGFDGEINIIAGAIRLDGGNLGTGAVHVATGGSLGGHGSISGAVDIADGGTLFGASGQQLSFGDGLTLGVTSNVDVTLNGGSAVPSLFNVNGDLALNGKLNVVQGSAVGLGVYRIFDYSGSLTDNSMALGTVTDGDAADYLLQTSVNHQVNLVSTGGRHFLFWDGDAGPKNDSKVGGGNGAWNGTNDDWTGADGAVNAGWHDDTFAVFEGAAGRVTVDGSNGFKPQVNGMQFMSSGYALDGGSLTLGGTGSPLIIVGDGSSGSANTTAEIKSGIEGNQGLTKSGAGNLVLTGVNSYTGDTTISQGALTLGDGGRLNDQSNLVLASSAFGDGVFAINKNQDFKLKNNVSGTGKVVKDGTGTTTFAGRGSFNGGLIVKNGTAQAGVADDAFGAGAVVVNKDGTLALNGFNETIGGLAGNKSGDGRINLGTGTLTLNQDLHGDFSGVISGTGGLVKMGAGDLVLYGANDYSGETVVDQGSLVQGGGGGFSANSTYMVARNAEIDLNGLGTTIAGLFNAGTVVFGGKVGTSLYVAGNYTGQGGTVVINSVLGGDHSQTDMLKVGGNTSGDTNLKVINRGGLGGKTTNGIEVVSVDGQSNGTFSLVSDYTTRDGQKAVVAGAYAYTLQQGSGSGNKDDNWYLTSQITNPGPKPGPGPDCQGDDCPNPGPNPDPDQRYSAGVPVYEGYAANLQALNKLPTLQERVGERYWTGKNGDGQTNGAMVNDQGVWARIEGAHNRLEPQTVTGGRQDINTFIMQAGVDGHFYEDGNGKLIAGITGQYGHAKGNISSFSGDGDISTDAWSLGATTTWYGNNGFYVDGQAQVTWFDSDLNSDTANTGLADGRKATGYAVSIEAGQRIAIDQNWSLTPQAQLMYSSVDANAFRDTWGSRVSLHDGDSLIGRFGLAANYASNWKDTDGLMVNTSVYGIANIYQEFLGGTSVNVAGVNFDTGNDKTWAGIGAGGTYAWAENKYSVYSEGSINTSLHHFANSYALKGTVGFKVKW